MTASVVLTIVATAVLVVATANDHRVRYVAKPLASLGFVLVGLGAESGTLRWSAIVAGLVLGALGDVLLMGSGATSFLAGLAAFLAGHLAYVLGFATDLNGAWTAIGAVTAVLVTATVGRWLRPHLDGPFRIAVPLYIIVIGVMLAAGIGNLIDHPLVALGAVAFTASDVFVARDRFVSPARVNALIGLPLYYAGQLAIAASLWT